MSAVGKRCGRCGAVKPLVEFHRRRTGYQTWCKGCRREYDAAYHAETRDLRLEQKRAAHERFRTWYLALKQGRPCTDCGGKFHSAAMVWDHLPEHEKVGDLGNMVGKHSRRRILEEIAKCEFVCANCHAVRTHERLRGVAQPG